MPIHLRLFLVILGLLFLVSCSSSKTPESDTDVLPDIDTDSHDSETVDDDSDSQESEIIDDSDEMPDKDSDSDECQPSLSEAPFHITSQTARSLFAARIATLRPKKIPFASAISGMSRMKNFVMNALNTHVVVFHAQWKVLSL